MPNILHNLARERTCQPVWLFAVSFSGACSKICATLSSARGRGPSSENLRPPATSVKNFRSLLQRSSKMVPDKNARLRELISLVANENNARKRKILALELQRLLNEEQDERDGGWSSPLGELEWLVACGSHSQSLVEAHPLF